MITDEYGNKTNGAIFTDAYGQYYTKDKDNNVFPVIPVENLDEVNVTAPRNIDMLADAFSRSLVMGNDKTQVRNLPHREYNTQLKANVERGAKEHALWDEQHPNLSAWRDAATAVPFAVASAPLVLGGGQGLLGTTAGQAAKHGIAAIMENPYVAGTNDVLGLGFAGKGTYDVSQGKFTPETAMELTGFYPFGRSLTGLTKSRIIRNSTKSSLVNNNYPNDFIKEDNLSFSFKQDPLKMHIQRVKANGKYDPSKVQIYNLTEDSERNAEFLKNQAEKYGISPEEVRRQLLDYLATSGHGAAYPGEGIVIHDGKADNISAILSHEFDHALHIPDEPVPEGTFYPRLNYIHGDYFVRDNNTDVAAKGSQLRDYFGHTSNEPLTKENLLYARDHYVKDTGVNNNMNDLLWSTKDYDALAKWMTKYSTGIIPLGIIGNNQLNNNK